MDKKGPNPALCSKTKVMWLFKGYFLFFDVGPPYLRHNLKKHSVYNPVYVEISETRGYGDRKRKFKGWARSAHKRQKLNTNPKKNYSNLANSHYMLQAKMHVMKLAYARGAITKDELMGLLIPTCRDLTNIDGDLGYKHAAVSRRTWSQVDETVAELAARLNGGMYLSRRDYFSSSETIAFYAKHQLEKDDMVFRTSLSDVCLRKYGHLIR